MQYYSLNRSAPDVDFREATIRGQAPDKGLYFPEKIPSLRKELWTDQDLSTAAVSFEVMRPFVGDKIDDESLYRIVAETVNFPFPLVPVKPGIFSLELFHGPTLAFKDVGARFMSRCLGYFSRGSKQKITVLVATSGDTGGAVANGFLGVEGVEVVILYPSKKVSPVQELQLTTCGQNITALEINGSFDDCQAMVKDAFMDADLAKKLQLTSANSINVARWLPQQLYYIFALRQWHNIERPPVFSVPSGNFGNLCAALVAHIGGMPASHFLAACNVNDAVPEYLRTGHFAPKKVTATISNAMDVGAPSNFIRILELFQNNYRQVTDKVTGFTVTDVETVETITNVFQQHNYLLDPHGAVACYAMDKYLENHAGKAGIILETAHPVKFPETVEQATGQQIEVPANAAALFGRQKQSIRMNASFDALKEYLMNK